MTKILVVDDDLLVLATISIGLQHIGYEVFQADSAATALEASLQHKPDLTLLDIRMPDCSGVEVAKTLNQHKLPFIFLSAYSDSETLKSATSTGALGYLVKPLEISQIVPAIEIAIVRADERTKAGLAIENISFALEHNREIDVAIGILMERHHSSRAGAFEKLRVYARSNRIKVLEVAKSLIAGKLSAL